MTNKKNSLLKYKTKRNFDKTPEPEADNLNQDNNNKKPIFVIQKHDASHLHYDFRLEVAGVLKSWALPKGPTTDPKERHLAVETEDHPLEYANFEGIIPEGQYGAGPVIIWDKGTYRNLRPESMTESINNGEISVWLEGQKLKGGYTLVKTKYKNSKKNWLLIKMKDEYIELNNNILENKPKSVISNKTIEQMEKQNGKKNK